MSDKMVLLAIFGNPVEAELARAQLEAAGIRAAVMGTTSGDLFAGMGVGLSNVQLLVSEGDIERAGELLDAAESPLARELREERESRELETAIEAEDEPQPRSTDIRPAVESPVQTTPTPLTAPAEGGDGERDLADEFPGDEDEREERSVLWTADEVASRALRAAIFGWFACPGLLSLYALWLVIRLPSTEGELSPAGSRKALLALVIAVVPGTLCFLLLLGLVIALVLWPFHALSR